MAEDHLLTTAEVARRLRIKPETIYAYVSRGLLTRVKVPGERISRFRLSDVERLAARTQGTRPERDAEPAMRTAITLIAYNRLFYRGRDAASLVDTAFEHVATLLWDCEPVAFVAPGEALERARRASEQLPPHARLADRLPVIVAVAAATDPLRFDLSPSTVVSHAPELLATMVDALPARGEPADTSIAARLWSRLTDRSPAAHDLRALNAALVLLADHDLAASTIAVRVAASTRAHPYAVVSAGLGALDGPMHGAVGAAVYRLVETAARDGAAAAIAEQLRSGGLPGLGQRLYPDGDPRARALLDVVPIPAGLQSTLDDLVATANAKPNIDFALAALAYAAEMGPGAAEVIFALARTAGWIAHAIEEYAQPPHRFRWSSGYVGPTPAA
ncbi:MAG: helix-turn-helix domain-containing protein [Hamadaea sp.]|uniref:citrate synthase n=1 Tax=Hamadaea sp. TaxID=2024425 RepID=UPI001795B45C|nr:citrate synthase [Hamadaea sp.]NUR48218.1 helix-turn-helix domain-containing protein [Hamadaea sp.]NUR73298.1 helix-turn-helix domain-containing protein [Hamadaea sp.]NUT21523.1 helix-turn-helix domain-containing protein [Hamadaea sp.]